MVLEEELQKLECHFTWGLQKDDADLNFLKIQYTENLSFQTEYGGNTKQKTLNLLAYIKHLQDCNDEALEYLERAEEKKCDDSHHIVTYGNLAWLHHHMTNDAAATVYMEKLDEILGGYPTQLPREVQSEKAWSFLHFSRKYHTRSKDVFYEALQKEPEDTEWNTGYAFSLFQLERQKFREGIDVPFVESPAVTQLKKAQELDPNNPMIHVYLGLKFFWNHKHAEAWDHMQTALAKAPYDLNVVLLIAKFKKNLQCYDLALEVLQKALMKAPESSLLHHKIGSIYSFKARQVNKEQNLGFLNLAIQHLEKGNHLNPNFLYPQMALALRYGEAKKYKEAEQKFQDLLSRCSLHPADLQAWHRTYGDFQLYQMGSERTAVDHYKEGMALKKVSTEWEVCQKRLRKILDNDSRDVYNIQEFMNSSGE